jgi:N-acetylmuramoyl-L-alanine amidase
VKFYLSGILFFATSLALLSHEEESKKKPSAEATDIVIVAPATWKGYTVNRDLVPAGKFSRELMEPMNPRYVTIHSTQNIAPGADALAHAKAQRQGKLKTTHNRLGYLAWHFTVDQADAIQSLPCNERGQHADFEGPGNAYSIGIEMCEHAKNDRAKTLDRTARLCALLMAEYQIPLQHIVPHSHWPRIRDDKKDIGHKNCPHFLLENGKPGKKWQIFLGQVLKHYKTHPKYNAALVDHPSSQPSVVEPTKQG